MAGAPPADEVELAEEFDGMNIAPNPPINLKQICSIVPNTVAIVWQPYQGNPGDHYILEIDDGAQGPFKKAYDGSECIYNVPGLHPQYVYRARVKAYNDAGESAYSKCVCLQAAPNPPINLKKICSTVRNTVAIVWQPYPGNPGDYYTLEIDDGAQGPFQNIFGGSECIRIVQGFQLKRVYRVRVKAHNHAGESAYSKCVSLQAGYYDDLASYIEDPGWLELLQPILESDEFQKIINLLNEEYDKKKPIYPPKEKIFRAFKETPLNEVKVVIFGQDPCPNHKANGLAFSADSYDDRSESLERIFRELTADPDVQFPTPNHGCLDRWARQGVLLLNVALTVGEEPRSHLDALGERGWRYFTNTLFDRLTETRDRLIFLLWGSPARHLKRRLEEAIRERHYFEEALHPSPKNDNILVTGDWPGCRHFSKVNKKLNDWGKGPINWSLQ